MALWSPCVRVCVCVQATRLAIVEAALAQRVASLRVCVCARDTRVRVCVCVCVTCVCVRMTSVCVSVCRSAWACVGGWAPLQGDSLIGRSRA
jgi:hypothetical protein